MIFTLLDFSKLSNVDYLMKYFLLSVNQPANL